MSNHGTIEAAEKDRILRFMIRLVIALVFVGGAFAATIYVQDLLQGDVRLPMQCLDEQGHVIGCPQPRPNLLLGGAMGLLVGGMVFRATATISALRS
jgi:hypothetical protein